MRAVAASHAVTRTAGGSRSPPRASIGRPLAAALLLAGCAGAWAAGEWPGIFLEAATVPRVKALALDSALAKGWHVAASGADFAVFETLLEEPASRGPPDAVPPDFTLLRIRTEFVKTPAGVNAYLSAEEPGYAGTPREWRADVTSEYRGNLGKALEHLQAHWNEIRRSGPRETIAGPDEAQVRVLPPESDQPVLEPRSDPTADTTPADIDVGTWAYYAEQFALEHGCDIADTGAELIAADALGERHRVRCKNGPPLVVHCDGGACADDL